MVSTGFPSGPCYPSRLFEATHAFSFSFLGCCNVDLTLDLRGLGTLKCMESMKSLKQMPGMPGTHHRMQRCGRQ